MTNRAESIRVVFKDLRTPDDDQEYWLNVVFWQDSVVSDLRESLSAYVDSRHPREENVATDDGLPEQDLEREVLILNGAMILRDSARLLQCQLKSGDRIDLTVAPAGVLHVPELSETDAMRLVHESGAQLGWSWPIPTDGELWLVPDVTAGGLLPLTEVGGTTWLKITHDAETDSCYLQYSADLKVAARNISYQGEPLTAGMAITLELPSASEEKQTLDFRLWSRIEHDQSRRLNGVVAHRARAREEEVEVHPQHLEAYAPSAPEIEPWDWRDIALTQGAMLLMYFLFIFRGGFNAFYAVFLLVPIAAMYYRWYSYKRAAGRKRESYQKAIAEFDQTLGKLVDIVDVEAGSIQARNPDFYRLAAAARNRDGTLWSRRAQYLGHVPEGFLKCTVGVGIYHSSSSIDVQGREGDPFVDVWKADAATLPSLANAPIEADLRDGGFAIVGALDSVEAVAAEFLLRTLALHSPSDVSLVLALPRNVELRRPFAALSWLPHLEAPTPLWLGTRVVMDATAFRSVLLDSALALPEDSKTPGPWLLLVVHESSGADPALIDVLVAKSQGRIIPIWLGSSLIRVPDAFSRQWVAVGERDNRYITATRQPLGEPLSIEQSSAPEQRFEFARSMSPLVDERSGVVSQAVPGYVPLANLVDRPLGQVENTISAGASLIASIGETATGRFDLDLVEQGPHLLVAGTTGSGKSELLRTLVCSLLARYDTLNCALLLIDFKGGASLGEFADTPHCIGMVSNLSGRDIDRLVGFLRADIARRQKILAPFNGEYVRYRAEGHLGLPRLVVVIDEFQGFVSTDNGKRQAAILDAAARGRSLGVHLVIATQSPKSVVSGSVLANVNARIALRMLDEADSHQVVDDGRAYRIPRSLRGRAFARLDSGSLVEFQSGFTLSHLLGSGDSDRVLVSDFDPLALGRNHSPESRLPRTDAHSAPFMPEPQRAGKKEASEQTDAELHLASTNVSKPTDSTVVAHAVSGWPRPRHEDQPALRPSLLGNAYPDATTPPDSGGLYIGLSDIPEQQVQVPFPLPAELGAISFWGSGKSGRTSVLAATASSFAAKNPRGQIVAIDGGGGDLTHYLGRLALNTVSSPWIISGDATGDIAQALTQLEEEYPLAMGHARGSERALAPVLLLMDRVDLFYSNLRDWSRLARVLTEGHRRKILIVATCDPRVVVDVLITRALKHRYLLIEGFPGMFEDSEREGVVHSLFDLQSDFQAAPRPDVDEVEWQRPLGPPPSDDGLPGADEHDDEPGVLIGIDMTHHRPVRLALRSGLAISGSSGSGKTQTLLSLAYLFSAKYGSRMPILLASPLPEFPSWGVDWRRLLVSAVENGVGTGRLLAETLFSDRAFGSILFVDDLHLLRQSLLSSGVPENLYHELFQALNDFIRAERIRIVASGPAEMFYNGSPQADFGGTVLTDRMQMINLQPLKPQLYPAIHGNNDLKSQLIMNPDDREYLVGEGALARYGRRTEIRVRDLPEVRSVLRQVKDRGAWL